VAKAVSTSRLAEFGNSVAVLQSEPPASGTRKAAMIILCGSVRAHMQKAADLRAPAAKAWYTEEAGWRRCVIKPLVSPASSLRRLLFARTRGLVSPGLSAKRRACYPLTVTVDARRQCELSRYWTLPGAFSTREGRAPSKGFVAASCVRPELGSSLAIANGSCGLYPGFQGPLACSPVHNARP